MRTLLLALVISWQGLFLGLNQTSDWNRPFKPGISATVLAAIGVGKVSVHGLYLQPKGKPAVQVGVSVRVF